MTEALSSITSSAVSETLDLELIRRARSKAERRAPGRNPALYTARAASCRRIIAGYLISKRSPVDSSLILDITTAPGRTMTKYLMAGGRA